ncbi:DNA repair protein RecN [Comamonas faecalis]|uniref:DNA repair protein RecN n=1 Tax=Comamonas faecalis TaxID=1387849 RepID=A0ABP7RAS2_9BURK
MALVRVALLDFVIIAQLELELHGGFTVLTGETGAGKSILIDALQLLLGARADAAVVREGAQRADISAEFDALPTALLAWLDEAGIARDASLLLRRTIDTQGKSRAWINGTPATAAQMRALGEHLLDIHGQHAWQSLTRADAVRELLDAYAGASDQGTQTLWQQWRAARGAMERARSAQDGLQTERERLQWQIGEVDKLAPQADEWDELNAQHGRLSNAQALIDAAQGALDALRGEDDDARGAGALDALHHAQHLLQDQAAIDTELAALAQVLASCIDEAADAAHSLQSYLRRTAPDPAQLQALDDRLAQWMALARRYKRTPQELPALLADWKAQLQTLDDATDLGALQREAAHAEQAYRQAARALTQQRSQAAPRLARAITEAMQDLGMPGGRFFVQVEPTEPGPSGCDQVLFLVSSHPGMTQRPIAKVASGGELSRIALAISVTTSELGQAPTLIFDEVDSGVGGAVAQSVGRLMHKLGRARQVLAVTHLPQVAGCADHHLVVAKERHSDHTTSSVRVALHEERVGELARMLGGEQITDTTLAHAREMLMTGAAPAPARSARNRKKADHGA